MGMLALSRKEGERILIGESTLIEIVEIRGTTKVVVGISAPQDQKITRLGKYDPVEHKRKEQQDGI